MAFSETKVQQNARISPWSILGIPWPLNKLNACQRLSLPVYIVQIVVKYSPSSLRCTCINGSSTKTSDLLKEDSVLLKALGTLSADNEMHDDGVRNPRRIGSRVSFLVGKRKVRQCVVLRRRRLLVLRLVALAMAFKNVRNLLLINHNDGFIDDDEFGLLYDLFVSKDLDFP